MNTNEIKYVNRHKKRDLVLLQGWASNEKIFSTLNLNYNYIIIKNFDPFSFENKLINFLQNNGFEKVSLFGWSMGGFAAVNFAEKYEYLIDEIILCSVKKVFDKEVLSNIRALIQKNQKAFLYKFYKDCFSNYEIKNGHFEWFRKNLLHEYLNFDIDALISGLDYLSQSFLKISEKNLQKVKFLFGLSDKIISARDFLELKNIYKNAKFEIKKDRGHIPFLEIHEGCVDEL